MNLTWPTILSWLSISILAMPAAVVARSPRCIMYLTGCVSYPSTPSPFFRPPLSLSSLTFHLGSQHPIMPSPDRLQEVTHVALAFMGSTLFNEPDRSEWPLFTTVDQVRANFRPGTKVMVAIGGWGDTYGFSAASLSEERRRAFAENVARMVSDTGADGQSPCFSLDFWIDTSGTIDY